MTITFATPDSVGQRLAVGDNLAHRSLASRMGSIAAELAELHAGLTGAMPASQVLALNVTVDLTVAVAALRDIVTAAEAGRLYEPEKVNEPDDADAALTDRLLADLRTGTTAVVA